MSTAAEEPKDKKVAPIGVPFQAVIEELRATHAREIDKKDYDLSVANATIKQYRDFLTAEGYEFEVNPNG